MTRAATLLLCLLALSGPAPADVLHLEGGRKIDVDDWWIESDKLMYQSRAGVVGIPSSMLVMVEHREDDDYRYAVVDVAQQRRRSARAASQDARNKAVEAFENGKAKLDARDFELAASYFLEALRLDPDLGAARVGYALSEMARDRDSLALSVILDGLARNDKNPQFHEVLGDLRNREERVEDALESWRRAQELSPHDRLAEKIQKAERELTAGRDYAFSASSHFNLRYDAEVDENLAFAVMEHLEEAYWELARVFRHAPAQPITVQLFPRETFHDVTQADERVGGLYDGKIRVPLGGLRSINAPARAVLTHELAHAFIHSKTRGNCPRWLHEGLAQMMEGREAGEKSRLEAIDRLNQGKPGEWEKHGEFSYPIALSLTSHLAERRGLDVLIDVLDYLGEGKGMDEALLRVFNEDYAAVCRRWDRSLREANR